MTDQAAASDARPGLIDRLPWYTVPAILLGVPMLLAVGVQVAPEAVYDEFVWKYYWGPIKADGDDAGRLAHNGVVAEAGYNTVNTLSWVVLMGVCVLGLYQMFRRTGYNMDDQMIYGATSWVVAGSVWHVLQDTNLIRAPLEYLFITPPIYLLFAAGGVASFLTGIYLKRSAEEANLQVALSKLWLIQSAFTLFYLAIWTKEWDMLRGYIHPLWVAGINLAVFLLVRARAHRAGTIDPRWLTFDLALAWLAASIVYVFAYQADPWPGKLPGGGLPEAVWLAPLLAGAATFVVYLVAKWRGGAEPGEKARAYLLPTSLLLVFSQSLDGFATALGLDLAGYGEKHVLSGLIIDRFRELAEGQGWTFLAEHPTFVAFAPLKLGLALAIVYFINVYGKEDKERYPALIGLVTFCIIMVGMGPGVRNFVRLSLGV
ncbi:MAG: DUF63 family protein [Thermoplasmatota archaeon]